MAESAMVQRKCLAAVILIELLEEKNEKLDFETTFSLPSRSSLLKISNQLKLSCKQNAVSVDTSEMR